MSFQGTNRYPKSSRAYVYAPIDSLPIPFTLTDFGRAYLAQLRVEEEAADANVEQNGAADVGTRVLARDSRAG
jgi:hypothetical protein